MNGKIARAGRTVWFAGKLVLALVFVELFSAGAIWSLARITGDENLRIHVSYFHPLLNPLHHEKLRGGLTGFHQPVFKGSPFAFHPQTGFDLVPNTTLITMHQGELKVGPQGFVCNATCMGFTRVKPPNQARIFIMGGSVVQGTNPGGQNISSYLERMIRNSGLFLGKEVHVINAGVGGFFSPQQLIKLEMQVLSYEPDMVIWVDGHNDYRRWQWAYYYQPRVVNLRDLRRPNLHDHDYSTINSNQRLRTIGGSILHTLALTAEIYPVIYYTATLARYARRVVSGSATNVTWTPSADEPHLATSDEVYTRDMNSLYYYMAAVDSAAGLLRHRGIKGLFCLQPHFFIETKMQIDPDEQPIVPTRDDYAHLDEYYGAARLEFAKRRAGADALTGYCDLTPIYKDSAEHIYTDQAHLTPRGNEILAGHLFVEVQRLAQ